MKIALITDSHFGARNDSLSFNDYFYKFWEEVFFPYIKKEGIDTIIHLGDIMDRRKFVSYKIAKDFRERFLQKVIDNNITIHMMVGNHDTYFKNVLDVNSSTMLLNDYDNITIFDEPKKLVFDGVDVDVIPWICSDNEEGIIEFIKNSKSQICFGHFEIAGFEMDRGNVCHEGLDKNILKRYDVVLSGHFHHKSTDGQITYVGTPGEMTWADYNDERGFHIFDTQTRELEFVLNPNRIFHKITYDDSNTNFEFWKKHDYSTYKDSYVKVVVLNKQNPYLFDSVIDNLYKCGVSNLAIVEDFTETIIENDQDLINQAEDTITILNKHIDNISINASNIKLKSLMKELYIEALNTETE